MLWLFPFILNESSVEILIFHSYFRLVANQQAFLLYVHGK